MRVTATVPPDDVLVGGIRSLSTPLARQLHAAELLSREENWYGSTFASEIVTVRTSLGVRRVFCKHGVDYVDARSGLHRGPGYEARVYSAIDGPLEGLAPRFFGSFEHEVGVTLVLSCLPNALRVNKAGDDALISASERLGRLHRSFDDLTIVADLNRYDATHFEDWVRALDEHPLAPRISASLSPILGGQFDWVDALGRAPATFVHGELFPSNVLVSDGTVHFVDWETAGVGPGELDLCALTLGHGMRNLRRECESTYANARWGAAVPDDHMRTLAAATAYLCTVVGVHRTDTEGEHASWIDDEVRRATALLEGTRS
jgi:hypothetical protein